MVQEIINLIKTSFIFKTVYWGHDKSSRVNFIATNDFPDRQSISTCMVFAINDDKILLSKPNRGWGLPGGHIEIGESAEDCVRRELNEETSVEVGELSLIGYWKIEKEFDSPNNIKYPDPSYQLLFLASVTKIKPFIAEFETSERKFVSLPEIPKLKTDYENVRQIFEYANKIYELTLK